MDKIKEYAKSIVAFVLAVVGNMIIDFTQNGVPFPQTQGEWIRYITSSLVIALGVAGTPNKMTEKQAQRGIDQGVIVDKVIVPAIAKQASNAAKDAVQEVAQHLPASAQVIVADASKRVSDVVDQAIKDYQNRPR